MTIRELRQARKLTQARFAELIGVNKSAVGHLENGRMKISDRIADKIWEVFGVEVSETETKKPAKKACAPKLEIYIQSPLGGNITPEEVTAKMPEGTEACFVRVDQNKIWWVRENGETGYVWIWD
jgi:transcriptional regulator with XRE-family HTH domain